MRASQEWTEAGVSASRVTTLRRLQEKGYLNQRQRQKRLTWAVEKKNWTVAQWSKVLFSDESKFCISFGNQGPRKILEEEWRGTEFMLLEVQCEVPQSVMIWAAMSSAGVGPLCFLKSTVNAAIYQDILEHYMLPSAVLLCLIGQQIRWIENLWGIVKRKMRDTRRNNADDLKAAIKATWASIPPQQCHKLITSMPCRIEAVIKAKGAPTKYWVHIE